MNQYPNESGPASAGTTWISIFVGCTGLAVMFGWVFDIGWLKSIRPDFVTMKFATAMSFLFSGITLYYISRIRFYQAATAMAILPVSVMVILLSMVTFLASTMLDIYIGIEMLFVEEAPGAVETVTPGRPSVGTMIAFLLVAYTGVAAMLRPENLPLQLLLVGLVVLAMGLLAVCGYILDMPMLYYYVEGGISTAMALHTAILFVMLGVGLVRLK